MGKQHNRKLGVFGTAMTTGRIPAFSIQVLGEVRNDVEAILLEHNFFADAPFDWVTISLRYGIKNESIPRYAPINREYGDLPLAIELDTNELRNCNRRELQKYFMIAVLNSLIHCGRKFKLPTEALQTRMNSIDAPPV